ncbi:non-canonical purine NTP pyrophosphatase [Hoyosella subflava]|uniref:dITP/XTP pyrophosphatase n=1 Tax=Hoyosella subflava (strain DSM 45089 / JCM 17490 / NBRC 109087 / DQS3-9A1) TaxID=443218 RepID=F6ES58_HOYSD|nr:non-canonical purine NTP pyrophosphatase [Hoyosella subflava]AEF42062.1 Nucleoside-triphosphatase [Hoyosella subflava DQS3-9A1]
MSKTLLVASRNQKKLAELRRILDVAGIAGITLVGLGDVEPYTESPETGETFEQNALAKARDGAQATGLACVADDSGLEVAALHGMPGVLSARWSGEHGDDDANNRLLLGQLRDVTGERRSGAFVSACALVVPDGVETVVRGTWKGRIATQAYGEGGFGYDPIFIPNEALPVEEGGTPRTAAQMTADEKDAVSHRGQALRKLVPALAHWASS